MTENDLQRQSASYRLAALDEDFILGDFDTGRSLPPRICQGRGAPEAMGSQFSTIVVFGSARTHARRRRRRSSASRVGACRRRRCRGQTRAAARWYEEPRAPSPALRPSAAAPCCTTRTMARQRDRHRRRSRHHGGGQPRRLRRRRASSASTSRCRRAGTQPLFTPELSFQFHYFAMRKLHFVMRAEALVVFPAASARSTSCSRSLR